MLTITIEEQEFYNADTNMFFKTKPQTVRLEHSLISISKWESFWKKPYLPSRLSPGISGSKEELHYLKCMILGNEPSDHVITTLQMNHRKEITDYIGDKQTATIIHRIGEKEIKPGATITSELIYYWMIKFFVPFECEKWHFNRLMALLDVCALKEKGNKNNLSRVDSANWRHKLNEERRKAWASR